MFRCRSFKTASYDVGQVASLCLQEMYIILLSSVKYLFMISIKLKPQIFKEIGNKCSGLNLY